MALFGDIEFVKEGLRLVFGIPAAQLCKLPLEFAGAHAVFVGKVGFGIQRVFLVHYLHELFVPEHNSAQHGDVVIGILVLLQNRHALGLVERDFALVRLYFAAEYFKEGRLARAVGADYAIAVSLSEFEVDVLE